MAEKYTLKQTLYNFSQNTSAHGWSRLVGARNWLFRITWLVLLAGAWTMIAIQLNNLYRKYNSRPVSTKMTLVNSPLDFPAVTICNHNSVQYSKISQERSMHEFIQSIDKFFWQSYQPDNESTTPATYRTTATTDSQWATTPDTNGSDFPWDNLFDMDKFQGYDPLFMAEEEFKLRMAAYPFDNLKTFVGDPDVFIVRCTYGGRDCDSSDFEVIRDYNYGMCYTFPNSQRENKSRTAHVAGQNHGLQLILNIRQFDYVPYVSPTAGVRVAIHQFKSPAYPYETGFSVPPGMESSVSLKMDKIKRLSAPYGDCSPSAQHTTLVACIRECIMATILSQCSCSRLLEASYRMCMTAEDLGCVNEVITSLQDTDSPCSTCAKPCNETVYSQTISNSFWPSDVYEEALRDQVNFIASSWEGVQDRVITSPEESRKNLLKLNIFYGELYVQSIEEEIAYSIEQFASDIGGQLGLWAGISILSLTECVELFLTLCEILVYRLKPGSRKTTSRDTDQPSTNAEKTSFQEPAFVRVDDM